MSTIDPTYHGIIQRTEQTSPEYLEYRRLWYYYPQNHIVSEYPIHIDLELNTTCNLKCKMCFQSFDPPEPAIMPLDLVYKVLEECAGKTKSVKLQCRGEPLLYKDLLKVISLAKDLGYIEVMFNTNGTLLTREMADGLILAGLDKIIISVDHSKPSRYKKIRIGADFDKVHHNVVQLAYLRDRIYEKERPFIRAQIIDFPEEKEYLQETISFWSKYADQVSVIDLLDYKNIHTNMSPYPEWCCAQPWQRLLVLANGDVIPCTGLFTESKILGNANNTTIYNLWHSKEMGRIRKMHTHGLSHCLDMCRVCPMRNKFFLDKYKDI